jgi:hypothetical protein
VPDCSRHADQFVVQRLLVSGVDLMTQGVTGYFEGLVNPVKLEVPSALDRERRHESGLMRENPRARRPALPAHADADVGRTRTD